MTEKLFSMMKMMAFVLLEQEEEIAQKQLMEMETLNEILSSRLAQES